MSQSHRAKASDKLLMVRSFNVLSQYNNVGGLGCDCGYNPVRDTTPACTVIQVPGNSPHGMIFSIALLFKLSSMPP